MGGFLLGWALATTFFWWRAERRCRRLSSDAAWYQLKAQVAEETAEELRKERMDTTLEWLKHKWAQRRGEI